MMHHPESGVRSPACPQSVACSEVSEVLYTVPAVVRSASRCMEDGKWKHCRAMEMPRSMAMPKLTGTVPEQINP
eukprot:scaffold675170_cov59-Prasinocladus_malaysianus.AAC.1